MDILFLLVGLVLGFVVAFLWFRGKQQDGAGIRPFEEKITALDKDNAVLQAKLQAAADEYNRLQQEFRSEKEQQLSELEKLRADNSSLNGRIERSLEAFKAQEEKYVTLKAEMENVHKKYSTEFENIANKILEEKSSKFTEQNKSNLDIILNPLKEKIKDFEEKVDKAYKTESVERITLKAEIKHLIDLNKQVSEEANNLAKALKGENKTQGNWGELILEKVLERSGLIKDQEYQLQYSTSNDEGKRIQPDVVVMLPDNKHVIVDAKVSLVAYEAFISADGEAEKDRYLKEHVNSVRAHIKGLSEKNYPSSPDFNTPDFVLLFIPIESSFSLALQADNDLFAFAWDRKIVVVSPSTLLATLRTISSIWKQERQTRNALEIAKQSGALYDKFVGFIEDMDKIGKNLDTSKAVYESAINKLHKGSGNLVKRAQDIEKLGAKATKQLPGKFIDNDSAALTDETNS